VSRFLERLHEGPVIVADGGVGTLIASRVARLRCPEEANIRDPETVLAVHLGFIKAGSELIETNTFGANRHKLTAQLLDDHLVEIIERGVKIAREAREVSGDPVLIGGSIGPLGDFEGRRSPEERFEIFAEQARLLEGRGVDAVMVETFFDLDELLVAVEAVKSVSSLPIVTQLSFDEGGETLAGVRAGRALVRAAEAGAVAVGANCGSNPQAALEALSEMAEPARARGIPLSAQPNVGLPSRSGGRLIFASATPDYFAEFAAQARSLGARIIGACCGSTPAQIAAIKAAVDEERTPRIGVAAVTRDEVRVRAPAAEPTSLQRKLEAGEWVQVVELDPPKGANLEGLLEAAARLHDSGVVDAVDVNDNPMARARMSALVAAAAIERSLGLETIPHVTPRDATVLGLQSQLLGAHSDGVRNVLAVTGDPPSVGDYPGSRGVYEVDSIGLTALLGRLNEGADYAGRSIDSPTSFYVGVAVNPCAEDLGLELERFGRKLEAGARFAMTQPLFDLSYLERFLELVGGPTIPILVGVWPLSSFQLAFRLHNEVPGIVVPADVQSRLAEAGADAALVGLEIARGIYEGCRTRAAGVYVIPPFREPEAALDLLAP
jgi:homocysteine S-methyltransferase